MGTVVWHMDEKIAVYDSEEGDLDCGNESEFIGENLKDKILVKEVSKIFSIKKSKIFLQHGIKIQYAWEVDEEGNL